METGGWEQEIERLLEEARGTFSAESSAIIQCVQKLNCLPSDDHEALKPVIEYLLANKSPDMAMASAFELGRAYEKAKSLGIENVWELK